MISLSSPAMRIHAFHIFPPSSEGLAFYFSQLLCYLRAQFVLDCSVCHGRIDSARRGRCDVLNGVLFEFSLFGLSFLLFGVVGAGVGVGVFGYWWVVLSVFMPVSWYKDSGATCAFCVRCMWRVFIFRLCVRLVWRVFVKVLHECGLLFEEVVMSGFSRVVAVAVAVGVVGAGSVVPVVAAPRVATQPGTDRPRVVAPVNTPVVQRAPQAPAVPAVVTNVVPGVTRAAAQPVVVRNYVTQEVYVTSPGLALASPGGAVVLNPVNVINTFERNVRPEDRSTMDAARGAAGVGAVAGGVGGGAAGALVGAGVGAAAGVGASGAICGAAAGTAAAAGAVAIAAPPTAPIAGPVAAGAASAVAACAAGGMAVGPIIGGAVGAGAGVPVGVVPGVVAGAQLGASAVPGGRAVMDRAIADTAWDLESQARVAQGAEPLSGAKPGDSMPGAGADAVPAVGSSVPALPQLPELPAVSVPVVDVQLPQVPEVPGVVLPGLPPVLGV
ncbi:hypothetical protein CMUST_15585 (plasmid) [Corynebacterium mustelae]|uniref:Uncharacterized protein n=2 Tax=Corynebacterium mustelae TaxID=571915 RepID=A0A0G3H1W8_9CORY|nr:hypothetical protein CMUST_15585 [Corynebacterium mustelae]